jgi:protein-S-isoprenylcysteine O-methyltransferase Ste14
MMKARKSMTEDWTMLPILVTATVGFVAAMFDFVFLQHLTFQPSALLGLVLLVAGGYVRMKARVQLKEKAGFKTLAATARLPTMEGHRLVKDGLYKHIRHPLYLGETVRNFGLVIIFSSIYGIVLIAASTVFIALRIRMEEQMLIQIFGEEYKEYQKATKRIIPYIY